MNALPLLHAPFLCHPMPFLQANEGGKDARLAGGHSLDPVVTERRDLTSQRCWRCKILVFIKDNRV